jgi:hypothetical protein
MRSRARHPSGSFKPKSKPICMQLPFPSKGTSAQDSSSTQFLAGSIDIRII